MFRTRHLGVYEPEDPSRSTPYRLRQNCHWKFHFEGKYFSSIVDPNDPTSRNPALNVWIKSLIFFDFRDTNWLAECFSSFKYFRQFYWPACPLAHVTCWCLVCLTRVCVTKLTFFLEIVEQIGKSHQSCPCLL